MAAAGCPDARIPFLSLLWWVQCSVCCTMLAGSAVFAMHMSCTMVPRLHPKPTRA